MIAKATTLRVERVSAVRASSGPETVFRAGVEVAAGIEVVGTCVMGWEAGRKLDMWKYFGVVRRRRWRIRRWVRVVVVRRRREPVRRR